MLEVSKTLSTQSLISQIRSSFRLVYFANFLKLKQKICWKVGELNMKKGLNREMERDAKMWRSVLN